MTFGAAAILSGCGPSTTISVADVNAARTFLRSDLAVAQPVVRSSWFAQGRVSNVACIIIEKPKGWADDRNTLRFYYQLDTKNGTLEPHRGPAAVGESVLDREADAMMFEDYWGRDCAGYAPFERRLTQIFGW